MNRLDRGAAKPDHGRPHRRPLPSVLVLALVMVVTLGGLAVFFVLGARAQETVPDQTAWMPAETLAFVTINADRTSRQWIQARDLLNRYGGQSGNGTPAAAANGTSPVSDQTREETLGRFAEHFGLSWDDDLVALVGAEASLGVLDYDRERGFALIDTTDPAAAWDRTLTALRTAAGNADEGAVYQNRLNGIDVAIYQEDGETKVIAGLLDTRLMLATDVESATRLIDVFRGNAPSLKDRADYQPLAEAAAGEYLVFAFVDGRSTLDGALSDQYLYDAVDAVVDVWHDWDLNDPDSFDRDRGVIAARGVLNAAVGRPMTIRLAVDAAGLTLHQYQQPGTDRTEVPAYDVPALDRVPADVLAYVAGDDLWNRYEQPIVAAMTSELNAQGYAGLDDARAEARDGLGFDAEFHVLSLLDGRFAGSLSIDLNDTDQITGQVFAEVNDPTHMRGSLAEIDEFSADHGLDVEDATIAGDPATVLSDWGSSTAMHELDDDGVTAALGRDVEGVFDRAETDPLGEVPAFQSAIAALPPGATFYGYVNLVQVVDALETAGNLPDLGDITIIDWRAIDAAGVAVRQSPTLDETVIYLHLAGA